MNFQCGPPKAVECQQGMSVSLTVSVEPRETSGASELRLRHVLTIEWVSLVQDISELIGRRRIEADAGYGFITTNVLRLSGYQPRLAERSSPARNPLEASFVARSQWSTSQGRQSDVSKSRYTI